VNLFARDALTRERFTVRSASGWGSVYLSGRSMLRRSGRRWRQSLGLAMMLCFGMVSAQDGVLCPMTGRPMANYLVKHPTTHRVTTPMTDCANDADQSMSTSSNHAVTRPSDTESQHTRPSPSQWPSCCAGHVLTVGIPGSGPVIRTVRFAAMMPVQRTPFLATRVLTPEPPPPKTVG
jgi:hypothetical protein